MDLTTKDLNKVISVLRADNQKEIADKLILKAGTQLNLEKIRNFDPAILIDFLQELKAKKKDKFNKFMVTMIKEVPELKNYLEYKIV